MAVQNSLQFSKAKEEQRTYSISYTGCSKESDKQCYRWKEWRQVHIINSISG